MIESSFFAEGSLRRMNDFLHKLFHTSKAKDFAALFKEAEKKYQSPEAFLTEVSSYLPARLYEHYYQETVPHSFFGLMSAYTTHFLFPEGERWRPFAQQCWFATRERKRTPVKVDTNGFAEGSAEERWKGFQDAAGEGDLKQALATTRSFLENPEDRKFFRQASLLYAMEDSAYGGHKFLYLCQAWRLAEALHWKHVAEILFPALHCIVVAPGNRSLGETVRESWRQNPLQSLLENTGQISSDLYQQAESTLLFDDDLSESLRLLQTLANAGVSLQQVQDTLMLSAAQALSNSDAGQWIWPMRAFHFSYLQQFCELDEAEKTFALLMSAAILNRASARSREVDENRDLDEVAQKLCPVDPFSVLKSVISHTDPHASATAVHTILGMNNKEEELFQTLLAQAVKNDGEICYGNDILFIQGAFDCYQRCRLEERSKLALSAGYFLGRVRKSYELFGAYGF